MDRDRLGDHSIDNINVGNEVTRIHVYFDGILDAER
jgi:hypothetical protein